MSGGGATEITGASPMAGAPYVKAKTCVWWDIENCQVPISCDPYLIAQNISKSLADMNYKGAVTIYAYGDTRKINSSAQQALSSTGIALNHVPAGIKDASDKKILVDMLMWGYDNPPPANHLLISGDPDFSNALHQLSMRRYNVLLAQPEKVSQALVSATKTVWLWSSLVEGGRPSKQISNFHNTMTNSKSTIEKESKNNNGNLSKTQSQQGISTSSKGNAEGDKQSAGSFVLTATELDCNCITSSTNPTPCIPKPQQLVDSDKSHAPCGPTIKQNKVKKIPSNTPTSTTDGSGVQESTIDDMTKISNDSTIVDPESSKPCSDMASSNPKNETQPSHAHETKEGGSISNTSSSFSTKSSSQVLPESNCITCNMSPTPFLPKSQQFDSVKFNAPCGSTSSYKPKIKQKIVQRIPSNIVTSTTDVSEVQESTINDTAKINNNSTLPRPPPLVVPESSKPLSNGPIFANIQPFPGIASSNHENELTQPSHAHEAQEGGNTNNTSSSFSSSSQVVPESDSQNAPKSNPNTTFTNNGSNSNVKNVTKKNRNKSRKQQQNQYSESCLHSTVLSGSNYNDSSSSSSVPTIRPDDYQSVPSSMPDVSPSTPIHDIRTSSSNKNEEGNEQSIGRSDSSNLNEKNDLKHPNHSFVLTTAELGCIPDLVSAAKAVWLWISLVVGGRPVENIPNLHDTLTNGISNNETQSNSIFCSSQPHDVNRKNNNNGNLDNHGKAKQISKTQSRPIISMVLSSNGNEGGSKQSIGSSDSSNPNQKNDLKHPNHTFVLTTTQGLGSNCIASNTSPTPFIPESQNSVDSGKFNIPCVPTSSYTPKTKKKKVKKIPSDTATSTTDGSGVQESTIDDMIKINNSSTLSRPSPLVTESGKSLSTGHTFANIQPSHDMASSNHENELTQPSDAHEAKGGGNISKTSSSFSTKSSSEVLPESNCITSNTNPTPCVPESQNLADSGKFNAPCVPTSNYPPKIKKKKLKKIQSNTITSTTDGSGAHECAINDTIKVNNRSILSQPSPIVVPESSRSLSLGPTFANIEPSHDMASNNHENEPTQPSHAHEAKGGGNISKTSSSFSTKSSSEVLPESNCITSNTNTTPCVPESQNLVDSGKFNAPCVPTSNYPPKIKKKKLKKIPSNTITSTTDGSGTHECAINDVIKGNNRSILSQPSPLVVPESSKSLSIGPTFANIEPSHDMVSNNHENEPTQPSHAHEAKGGGNISITSSSFSTKSSSEVLPESNCIMSNTNLTPCIPGFQQSVDSCKFNAPCGPSSNYTPKIKKKKVKKIPSDTTTSTFQMVLELKKAPLHM